jgi:hypothetical protein
MHSLIKSIELNIQLCTQNNFMYVSMKVSFMIVKVIWFHNKNRVKCLFSTCALNQNQIVTLVFKNITNGTYGYQINPLGTSVRIPLVFLTEWHVTLTHSVVTVVSRCHVA